MGSLEREPESLHKLLLLLNDRNNSIRAFQQLEESPENRDIFVSREKERAEIEKDVE